MFSFMFSPFKMLVSSAIILLILPCCLYWIVSTPVKGDGAGQENDSEIFFLTKKEILFIKENHEQLSEEYFLFLLIRNGDTKEYVELLLGKEKFDLNESPNKYTRYYLSPPPIGFLESPYSLGSIKIVYEANKVFSLEFLGKKLKPDSVPVAVRDCPCPANASRAESDGGEAETGENTGVFQAPRRNLRTEPFARHYVDFPVDLL